MMSNPGSVAKIILLSFSLLCIGLAVIGIFDYYNKLDKVAVEVSVLPENSVIKLDDKTISAGVIYLKEGSYKFSITSPGFKTESRTFNISSEANRVALIAEPESDEAKKIASSEEYYQKQAKLGSIQSQQAGTELVDQNPIIRYLPKTDLGGPYKIDYGFRDSGSSYIIISYSTPGGRINAMNWIRSVDVDPTSLDIVYANQPFVNPLLQGVSL